MNTKLKTAAIFLRPLASLLRAEGHDAAALFAAHGVQLCKTSDIEARIPADISKALLTDAQRRLRDPCLGISMARHSEYAAYGSLGLALLAGGNMRSVLERMARFNRLVSDIVSVEFIEDSDHLTIIFDGNCDHFPHPQALINVMASIMRMLRFRIHRDLNPEKIAVNGVNKTCIDVMRRYFRTSVIEGNAFAMIFRRDVAERQLDGTDPQLAVIMESVLNQRLADAERRGLSAQLSLWLENRLPEGEPALSDASSAVNMSVRSLQRRLSEESTSWHKLMENTRRTLAKRYMENGNMSITQMAFLLGFSDVSSFSRAFRKWHGVSPSRYLKSSL